MKNRSFWPSILIASSLAAGLAITGALGSPWRGWIVFWFLLACPGMAWIGLLPVIDELSRWVLSIAASLTLDTLVAGGMLLGKVWNPDLGIAILILGSLVGAGFQIARLRRQTPAAGQAS